MLGRFVGAYSEAYDEEAERDYYGVNGYQRIREFHTEVFMGYHGKDVRTSRSGMTFYYESCSEAYDNRAYDNGEDKVVAEVEHAVAYLVGGEELQR